MYDRIIEAALNETRSIMDLAEALYEEVGDLDHGEVQPTFQAIADAIYAAGGERRSRSTLMQYWRTAQWLYDPASGAYAWEPGVSFGAHNAARMAGLDRPGLEILAASSEGATVESVKTATVSTNTRRHRLDHDLARTLRRFADTVDRYKHANIPPEAVHWSELLNAYRRAEQAMRWVEKYLDTDEGDQDV